MAPRGRRASGDDGQLLRLGVALERVTLCWNVVGTALELGVVELVSGGLVATVLELRTPRSATRA